MATSYERLLKWSQKTTNPRLKVERPEETVANAWVISFNIQSPVNYSVRGKGSSIDDAAEMAIDQLKTVGVTVE